MVEVFFGWDPFLLAEYIFSAQILRALLRNKMEFYILEKVNNSIPTKMCANLLNNPKNRNVFSVKHNSMTKLCRALFKYENKIKIGWEN